MRLLPVLLAAVVVAGCGPVDGGAPTSGGSAPAGPSPTGSPAGTSYPAAPTPGRPAACPTAGAVVSATWTQAEGGRSLAVVPGEELRACAGPLTRWDGDPPGWEAVVELAGPEAGTPAMEQQYVCHLRFARSKEVWNLEPERPHVPQEELLRARCNP